MKVKNYSITIFLLVVILLPLFSDETASKVLTAFKRTAINTIPAEVAMIRIIDPESDDITAGGEIVIPKYVRGSNYTAFTWVVFGNSYGPLELQFSFYPLVLDGDENVSSANKIIPYKVKLNYSTTMVGDYVIDTTNANTNTEQERIACDFLSNRFFYFCDSISIDNEVVLVDGSGYKNKTVQFNMSSQSRVVQDGENNAEEEVTYSYTVCNYWTRRGVAIVDLLISDDGYSLDGGTIFTDGTYEASVVLSITKQ